MAKNVQSRVNLLSPRFYRSFSLMALSVAFLILGKNVLKESFVRLFCWGIEIALGEEFSCKDIGYEKGRLIFSDAVLKEKNYQLRAPKISLRLFWDSFLQGSVEVDHPEISISASPSLFTPSFESSTESAPWICWNGKLIGARINWPEAGLSAKMDAEKKGAEGSLAITLVSGLSELSLQMGLGEKTIAADFSHFDLLLLQPWIFSQDVEMEGGFLDGKLECRFLSEDSCHLVSNISLTDLFLKTSSGDISMARALFQGDNELERAFPLGWGRFDCWGGSWKKNGSSVEEIEGSFFYSSDLGMQGSGKAFGSVEENKTSIAYSLKGFWAKNVGPWIEIECFSPSAECLAAGDFTSWDVQLHHVQPFWGKFAEAFDEKKNPFPDWRWEEGEIDCFLQTSFEQEWHVRSLDLKNIHVVHKAHPDLFVRAQHAELQFSSQEREGDFLIEDLSAKWGDEMISQSWSFSGKIEEGQLSASKGEGALFIQGINLPCHLNILAQTKNVWAVKGEVLKCPFEIKALREEMNWSLSFEAGSFVFPYGIEMEKCKGRLTASFEDWAFENSSMDLRFGSELLHLDAHRLEKKEDGLWMDLRLRRGFWDAVRLSARIEGSQIFLDPLRTEILGSAVSFPKESPQTFENFSFSLEVPASCAFLLEKVGKIPPISGPVSIDFFYEKNKTCKCIFTADQLFLDCLPFRLEIDQIEKGWEIFLQTLDPSTSLFARCKALYSEGVWGIQEGRFEGSDAVSSLSGAFSGQCTTKGQGQLCIQNGSYEQKEKLSLQGKGCITFDLASFDYEMDGDLSHIFFKKELLEIQNPKPVHAFFSPSKGYMVQGIDCEMRLGGRFLGKSQVGLLCRSPSHDWSLHQMHLHMAEKGFSMLAELGWVDSGLDPHQDIDFVADVQTDGEFSSFSGFLKEGLLPWQGQLRHIQNLEFSLDEKEIFADFFYVHQNRDVRIVCQVFRSDLMKGFLLLQDMDYFFAEGEKPLEIAWRYEPHLGVVIDSIQGSFAGVDSAFYLQGADYQSHLIGSAKIDFQRLSLFVPPMIAEFFTELDMGKGYISKGKLHIDRKDLSQIFYTGYLTGKQIELCGYQFRTLFAKIDGKPEQIKLFDLKISDSSGFFKMDSLTMQGDKDSPWTFQIPLLSFLEFRPSLLCPVGGSPGEISPLVIRQMHFRNVQGALEDRKTYTAEGDLYFINSYKRARTIFDVPSDVLSRIIGLDIELLIPVRGKLRYALKNGCFEIFSLEDAYSEASRSQFFLNEKMAATLDLDGNLQIAVKMKQYVLFKLTEAFTILIDGKLKDPRYRLQKKK